MIEEMFGPNYATPKLLERVRNIFDGRCWVPAYMEDLLLKILHTERCTFQEAIIFELQEQLYFISRGIKENDNSYKK